MKDFLLLFIITILFNSCSDIRFGKSLKVEQTQFQTRSYQSSYFNTQNKEFVLRTIISMLQDLGFIIEKVDGTSGIINGILFIDTTYESECTDIVKTNILVENVGNQVLVELNAIKNSKIITEPIVYQNFFDSLSKLLFLEVD